MQLKRSDKKFLPSPVTHSLPLVFLKGMFSFPSLREPGAERGHTRASVARHVLVVAHQVVEGAGRVEQVERKGGDQVRHEPTFGL